jgi:hypothetical protein
MRFVLKLLALRLLLGFGLLFAAQAPAFALVHIDIDLGSQTMQVHSDSGASYVWPISSGRPGHATPRGVFRPRALYAMVHSAKYNNAPMPHSIFFHGQYAIHGTNAVGALGHTASHGCVRLSPAAAATLFAMVGREGAVIRILGSPPGGDAVYAHRHVGPAAYAHHHGHDSGRALAYAPTGHARTLSQWAKNPVAR